MINIWVGNLGAYNRGELRGEWINLPVDEDELQEKIENILSPIDEEIEIFDWESDLPIDIGRYSSPYRLNELAEEIEDVDQDILSMILEHHYPDVKEALIALQGGKYEIIREVADMGALAHYLVYEWDYLGEIPNQLREHLDWDSIINLIESETSWKVDDS